MTTRTQARAAIAAHNEAAMLQLQLEQAHVKVATLQSENRRLRKLTANGKRGRLLHRAAADARQLVGWRAAGYSITRRNVVSYGMPIRRWQWAIGLLKVARVVDTQLAAADDFLFDDTADCLQAIDHAVKVIEARGLETLILRLPRGAATAGKR